MKPATPGPAWALVPFGFVAWTAAIYVGKGEGWTVLWLCDICNVMLGLGLILDRPRWIWISPMWLVAGTPLWLLDDMARGELRANAVGIHLVSGALGLVAMRAGRVPGRVWPEAVGWLIAAQLVSRLVTPPELNVNLAHQVYPALAPWFPHYAAYWLFNVVAFALALMVLERVLRRALGASAGAEVDAPGPS